MRELFLVSLNGVDSLSININEVKRYLSICKNDTQSNELISWCVSEICAVAKLRAVYFEDEISIEKKSDI